MSQLYYHIVKKFTLYFTVIVAVFILLFVFGCASVQSYNCLKPDTVYIVREIRCNYYIEFEIDMKDSNDIQKYIMTDTTNTKKVLKK